MSERISKDIAEKISEDHLQSIYKDENIRIYIYQWVIYKLK